MWPVLEALQAAGGRPVLAGGCVRDWLLGKQPQDFDLEIYGISWDQLLTTVRPFGSTNPVGKQFAVVKLRLGFGEVDFSLPRKEVKSGDGHRGFAIEIDPFLDFATACARRDFTLNAILWDPMQGSLIDPHGGAVDLQKKILRHTSSAFREDPLRVLRAFQLIARFGFEMAPGTLVECQQIKHTFDQIPRERIWLEWEKLALAAKAPRAAFLFLEKAGWMDHFPFLSTMRETPQDASWHPEGDVWEHTTHCLDALVGLAEWISAPAERRLILFFATLLHDVGKISTTQTAWKNDRECIVSPGHDREGGPLAVDFLRFLGSPHRYYDPVRNLVETHMATMSWPRSSPSAATVRRLARKLAPAGIRDLIPLIQADRAGRPPLRPSESTDLVELARLAGELAIQDNRPKPVLQGRDLIALGWKPGPHFKSILNQVYEAQLEGDIEDRKGGLKLAQQLRQIIPGD